MKKIVIPLIIVAIVLGLVGFFVLNRPSSQTPGSSMMEEHSSSDSMEKNAMMQEASKGRVSAGQDYMEDQENSQMMEDEDSNVTKISGYISYTPAVYAAASDKRRILFFHATWCPTCKVANEDFSANSSQIPSDVVVLKTDYDTENQLKQKYNITYQHTFVQVDKEGNELAMWSGGGINELLENLK